MKKAAFFEYYSAQESFIVKVSHPINGELYKYPYLFTIDIQGQKIPKFKKIEKDYIRLKFRYEKMSADTVEKYVYFEGIEAPEIYGLKRDKLETGTVPVIVKGFHTYWGLDNTLVEDFYNNQGQLTESAIYSLMNNVKQLLKKTTYYCNTDGNVISQFVTDEAHIVYDQKFYIYSQDGWL